MRERSVISAAIATVQPELDRTVDTSRVSEVHVQQLLAVVVAELAVLLTRWLVENVVRPRFA